jgi:pimeloyl-ACP methyl ester carboxylesterase
MQINNRELYVEIADPGKSHHQDVEKPPTVIFLHHGLGSTRAWRAQVPAFTAAGYRTILFDRWGYGKSDPRPHLDVPGFKDDLADLHALITILGIDRTALVGHSDGGSIALYYAAQFPEQVQSLVVVAAHIYLEPKMEPGIQGIRHAFENDPRFRKGLQRAHGEKYQSTFYNWFDGWHKPAALQWDMRTILSEIQCPVLVIQGEDDEHATSHHAVDIAQHIPNAELWLVSGAKHMLPQEMPQAFNRKVLRFFKQIPVSKDWL